MKHSIVLTSLIPEAERDIAVFQHGIETFRELGVSTIEYYTDEKGIGPYQQILQIQNMSGIYLHAVQQKREGFNLSSLDEEERKQAVRKALFAAQISMDNGMSAMLITSGHKPSRTEELPMAYQALERSLSEILSNSEVPLLLEPGDRDIHMCQTVGPTNEAIALMERLHTPQLTLTMDSSHLAQLGESIMDALLMSVPWCNHVHLANCVLKSGHPLFGDRHPFFSEPEGVFTPNDIKNIRDRLPALWDNRPLTVAVEVIAQRDTILQRIEQLCCELPWFFDKYKNLK